MSAWQAYVNEDGGEAWAVWELLKGHCESDDTWEDARTDAGRTDIIFEGEVDDFDDDDYIWELLRDDIECSSEAQVMCVPQPARSQNAKQEGPKLVIVEDLLESDQDVEDLLASVRELSETVFKFDCVDRAEEKDWSITALTEVGPDGESVFCGFICYAYYPAPRAELTIKLLAVSRAIKGRGHGTNLMRWFLAKGAHMSESECRWLTVSAWDSAVSFYERFDFWDLGGTNEDDDQEEDEEDQVWMELKNVPIDTAAGADNSLASR